MSVLVSLFAFCHLFSLLRSTCKCVYSLLVRCTYICTRMFGFSICVPYTGLFVVHTCFVCCRVALVGCGSDFEFLAKIYCLRLAFHVCPESRPGPARIQLILRATVIDRVGVTSSSPIFIRLPNMVLLYIKYYLLVCSCNTVSRLQYVVIETLCVPVSAAS